MRLRTLEPFTDMENTQQQFHFKLNHECMCHSSYVQYKIHTSFSTGKSCRTDESTEHLRVIFRSRNLVIYILNELSKVQVQKLQESNMFWAFLYCVQNNISLIEETAILFFIFKKSDYALLHWRRSFLSNV